MRSHHDGLMSALAMPLGFGSCHRRPGPGKTSLQPLDSEARMLRQEVIEIGVLSEKVQDGVTRYARRVVIARGVHLHHDILLILRPHIRA